MGKIHKKHLWSKKIKQILNQQHTNKMTRLHWCFNDSFCSQGVLILRTLMVNQREMLKILQSPPFTCNKTHPMRGAKSCSAIQLLYYCGQMFYKVPVSEFIFSKTARLQKYFAKTLTKKEGQLFCRNTSVQLLPLLAIQKKNQPQCSHYFKNG